MTPWLLILWLSTGGITYVPFQDHLACDLALKTIAQVTTAEERVRGVCVQSRSY